MSFAGRPGSWRAATGHEAAPACAGRKRWGHRALPQLLERFSLFLIFSQRKKARVWAARQEPHCAHPPSPGGRERRLPPSQAACLRSSAAARFPRRRLLLFPRHQLLLPPRRQLLVSHHRWLLIFPPSLAARLPFFSFLTCLGMIFWSALVLFIFLAVRDWERWSL